MPRQLNNEQSVALRASEIVRQLMVYAGQESAALELVDLAAVVREMFPRMTVSAAKNAVFEFHLEDGLPLIRVTARRQGKVHCSQPYGNLPAGISWGRIAVTGHSSSSP